MLKKAIMVALAALTVFALSVSTAAASWYKHEEVMQVYDLTLTGQAKFVSLIVGSIECQTQAKVQLLLEQTTAHIEEFAIDNTKQQETPTELCITGGPLAPCDVTSSAADATKQNPWVAHLLQNKDTIEITTGTIQNHLEGADATTQKSHTACNVVQTIQLKPGKVHATIAAGETCTTNKVTLSGQLETGTGAKVTISGTQDLTPAGTYGTLC